MRRVETLRCQLPKSAGQAPIERLPKSVAIVFDEHQIVPPGNIEHDVEIERIAQRVSQHNGPRSWADGIGQTLGDDIASRGIDIDENRHATVLHDRSDRGRKTGSHGQHFIARAQRSF